MSTLEKIGTKKQFCQFSEKNAKLNADECCSFDTLVSDVSRIWQNMINSKIKNIGVTRSELYFLKSLNSFHKQRASQVELARAMNMGGPNVGAIVKNLIEKKLILLRGDQRDRRLHLIEFTCNGKMVMDSASLILENCEQNLFSGIPHALRDELELILTAVKSVLISSINSEKSHIASDVIP